jgi:hypothetical protein
MTALAKRVILIREEIRIEKQRQIFVGINIDKIQTSLALV